MVLGFNEFDELTDAVGLSGSAEKEALLSLYATLAASNLNEEEARTVLQIFSQEGLQRLSDTPKSVLEAKWRDFDYGNVPIGSYVRVKPGSYSESQTGVKHEGRIGVLVSMFAHRCRVRYIGLQSGSIIEHPMKNLESMNRGR